MVLKYYAADTTNFSLDFDQFLREYSVKVAELLSHKKEDNTHTKTRQEELHLAGEAVWRTLFSSLAVFY